MPSIDVLAPPPPPPPPPPVPVPEVQQETDTTPSTQPIVGIIYPPPEVRNIVDKTASFVARNGPEFEARIRQNEIGNPKFNFLNFGDPYHAYYQHKVKDFREGRGQEPSGPPTAPKTSVLAPSQQQKQQEILKQISEQPFIPKDPPPEFEFIADPPSISALDLDIVKLTAQFVARNGRQFLTNLMNREQRNYQFDFLRPQHSLFQYFTKLLEQYTKVLIPPKELMFKLKEESSSMIVILDMVKYRAEWIKYQEAQRRKEEEELEKERVAYAQIDWHDFVVVETVDYQPFEVGNFPPPTTPDEVGARVLMQERIEDGEDMEMQIESEGEGEDGKQDDDDDDDEQDSEEEDERERDRGHDRDRARDREREREQQREEEDPKAKEAKDNTQVQDMEEDSSDEEESASPAPQKKLPPPPPSMPPPSLSKDPVQQPPPLPPIPDKVIVKKGYDPKQAVKATRPPAPDEVLISPITGEKIPASKVQEHMRIGLLDPRWVEQRDRQIQDKLNQETVYAPGSAIEASLKQLAERRTDIFGVGDEETAIGKKIGEEDKKKEEKVTWDGHTSSVEAATRAARANITLEEQIHQIHKVKGLLPDEEKEKIGPKPVAPGRGGLQQQMQQPPAPPGPPPGMRAGPQNPPIPGVPMGKQPPVSTSAAPPPKPPPPVPPVQPPPPPPRPTGPPVPPMAPVPPPPGLLAPQPGMMMMPMSRPPIMVSARPPFSVAAPAPPMPGFMPPAPQMPPPPQGPQPVSYPQVGMKHPADGPSDDEPLTKKSNVRTEESLIPEAAFLAQHKSKGPVTFKVAIPNLSDKPEWRLRGQVLNLTLPLTDTVSVVKAKVHEETGMPPGKQKLHWEGLFFKDSNSLGFYNIMPGTIIGLQLKERGGRRK